MSQSKKKKKKKGSASGGMPKKAVTAAEKTAEQAEAAMTEQEPEASEPAETDEESIKEESSAENELDFLPESENKDASRKPGKKKKAFLAAGIALFVLLAGAAGGAWAVVREVSAGILPQTVAIGEEAHIPAVEEGFLSRFCRTDPPLSSLDTSDVGTLRGEVAILGFAKRPYTVTVVDRIAPALALRRITALPGTEFVPEDFVVSAEDQTALTFSFAGEADFSGAGSRTVTVAAEDVSGNRTEAETVLTLSDEPVYWEIGTDPAGLGDAVLARMPGVVSADLGECDPSVSGTWTVRGESGEERFEILLVTRDTIPPAGTAVTRELLLDTPLDASEFVSDIKDATEVTVSYAEEPDFTTPGEQDVSILLTDAAGNVTPLNTKMMLWDLAGHIEVESGTRPEEIRDALFASEFDTSSLTVCSGFDSSLTRDGAHVVTLSGRYGAFDISLWTEDTTPPSARMNSCDLRLGETLALDDLIAEITDVSAVTAEYIHEPDFTRTGEQTALIRLTDAAGNAADFASTIRVWDLPSDMTVESGTGWDKIEDALYEKTGPDAPAVVRIAAEGSGEEFSLADENAFLRAPGVYDLTLAGEFSELGFALTVRDTTPPKLVLKDALVWRDDKADPWDFVETVRDLAEVSVSFAAEPDTGTVGAYPVTVTARDAWGNESAAEAVMTVRADLDPPLLYGVRNLTAAFGSSLSLTDGVWAEDEIEGAVSVSVSPAWIDTSVPGIYSVLYSASDSKGNTADAAARITVLEQEKDKTPPVIYGVSDLSVSLGGTVSLRKNVWAEDENDGTVAVTVDSSALNTSVPGVYTVTYAATDAAGNTAWASAKITVQECTIDDVNALADEVLSWILPANATEREIARAVYDWCTANIRYSTATSYLMGQYVRGAYSGFTTYAGNCYIYYAVSAALLTRAGIENVMIQRNVPNRPHYWNLVKIDGSWYHFDTCPHYDYAPLECFLLTDAEVADYSANRAVDYYSFDSGLYPATP